MDCYDKTGNTSTSNQLKLRELPQSQITKVNMKYMHKQCIAWSESITLFTCSLAGFPSLMRFCSGQNFWSFGLTQRALPQLCLMREGLERAELKFGSMGEYTAKNFNWFNQVHIGGYNAPLQEHTENLIHNDVQKYVTRKGSTFTLNPSTSAPFISHIAWVACSWVAYL